MIWSVVQSGNNKVKVSPGRFSENVIAWWICDVAYDSGTKAHEFRI